MSQSPPASAGETLRGDGVVPQKWCSLFEVMELSANAVEVLLGDDTYINPSQSLLGECRGTLRQDELPFSDK